MTTNGDPRYGVSVSTFTETGLDRNMRRIWGPRVVIEDIARSWLTPRGSLITNPDRGEDIRSWIGSEIGTDGDYAKRAALVAEAQRDPRVEDIDLDLAFDRATEKLRVSATVRLVDADTPIDFVLEVGNLTTTLLLPKDLA